MMKTFTVFLTVLAVSVNLCAQKPGNVFTWRVGNFKVSMLSEGQHAGNVRILIDAPAEILNEYAPNGTFPGATNAFLVQTQDKNILIDAGYGSALFDNLQSLGITAEQIDVVLLTHMHGDHIGGMLRYGTPAFTKAAVYLPQPENDYWCDNEVMLQMPENRRDGFKKAQSIIAAYKDRLHLFQPDEIESNSCNLLAGITGIAIYGHTPGHTGYMLESEGQKLFVWGDLTHAMAVQMPHPEISVTYDVNPTQAAGSRAKVLEYVSKNRIPIAGMHIAFPGMGNIEKSGAKYIFKAFE